MNASQILLFTTITQYGPVKIIVIRKMTNEITGFLFNRIDFL